jgi:hypothetical protein
MIGRFIPFVILVALLGGCATNTYTGVSPGLTVYDGLQVKTVQAWNLAPAYATPSARKESRFWTQDGLLLDRIMIVPAVPDGEAIFRTTSKSQALPVFRADMLPNEIEELTESSIVKLFGEGQVSVETSGLRPHRFGEHRGFLFDMEIAVSDGPNYGGIAGAFVTDDKLYLITFLGAQPYYFKKHRDEALFIIRGATKI